MTKKKAEVEVKGKRGRPAKASTIGAPKVSKAPAPVVTKEGKKLAKIADAKAALKEANANYKEADKVFGKAKKLREKASKAVQKAEEKLSSLVD